MVTSPKSIAEVVALEDVLFSDIMSVLLAEVSPPSIVVLFAVVSSIANDATAACRHQKAYK